MKIKTSKTAFPHSKTDNVFCSNRGRSFEKRTLSMSLLLAGAKWNEYLHIRWSSKICINVIGKVTFSTFTLCQLSWIGIMSSSERWLDNTCSLTQFEKWREQNNFTVTVRLKVTLSSSRFLTAAANVGVAVLCKSQTRLCCDTLGARHFYFSFASFPNQQGITSVDMFFLLIGHLCDKHATDVCSSVKRSWGLRASISFAPPPLPRLIFVLLSSHYPRIQNFERWKPHGNANSFLIQISF